MSIAIEILRELEALIAEHGIERVEEVRLQAGAMRQIVPEALEIAFASLARGTPAEGARLRVETVPVLAACRPCGKKFRPEPGSFVCPECGKADAEAVEGDDIVIVSVTGDQKEGAASNEHPRGPERP